MADVALTSPFLELTLGGKVAYDTTSITTDLTLEYNNMRMTTFRGTSNLILQKQQEGDATTYSSKLTATQSHDENPAVLEYSLTTSPSDLNVRLHFNHNKFDLLAEEKWTHTYENNVRKIKGEVSTKCEYFEMESFATTELTIAPNSIILKSTANHKKMIGETITNVLVDLQREPGKSLTARVNLDNQLVASADFKKVNPGHYTMQVSQSVSQLTQ